MVEAGSAYEDAIGRGLSDLEAADIANDVFARNVQSLSLSNGVQAAIGFIPNLPRIGAGLSKLAEKGLIKVTWKGGKLVFEGVTEGFEEYHQQIIQMQERGEDVNEWALANNWSNDELRAALLLGAILGVAMGGAMDLTETAIGIRQATIANVPDAILPGYLAIKADAIRQGISVVNAETVVLNWLSQQQGGPEWVKQVVDSVTTQARLSEMRASSTQEAQDLVDRATSTTKPVEGITYTVQNAGTENEDYRGAHRAPTGEHGEGSLDAMNRTYPDDIYDADAARIYGDRSDTRLDAKAIRLISSLRGKPDAE